MNESKLDKVGKICLYLFQMGQYFYYARSQGEGGFHFKLKCVQGGRRGGFGQEYVRNGCPNEAPEGISKGCPTGH